MRLMTAERLGPAVPLGRGRVEEKRALWMSLAVRLMAAERLGPAVPLGQGRVEEKRALWMTRGILRYMALDGIRERVAAASLRHRPRD